MRFISEKKFKEAIQDIGRNYPDCQIYGLWRRFEKLVVIPFTIAAYGIIAFIISRDFSMIFDIFQIEKQNTFGAVMCMIAGIIISNICLIILHEFIHLIALPLKIKNAVIVISLPFAISVEHFDWISKKEKLFVLIAPYIGLTLLIAGIAPFIDNYFLIVCFLIFNIILSSSDIYAFFYIFFKLPSNVFMFGNYYR